MILFLVLIPALGGAAAFAIRNDEIRRWLLCGVASVHLLMAMLTWPIHPRALYGGWLLLDAPGRLFLSITSVIFLMSALYARGYLARRHSAASMPDDEGLSFQPEPEAIFTGCMLLFLAAMSLITISGHFGLLWVAVEASTLASAPLIYYHRNSRSLEATWKYLVICSVGVALALLGNFLLAVAADVGMNATPLILADLIARGPAMQVAWLKAAFVFFLVGYGVKMGLAPLHNWLPDAHSEAPALVSALLSGALLNCAFLGILRAARICESAGLGAFARDLLMGFGLLSMALGAVFILRQADFKRMLAYSSIEHMGILALGVGLGGAAAFGAMLHAVNHSLTKALLFLLAGNILTSYRSKTAADVNGVSRRLPVTGALWLAGFFAITGSPPFGPFLSEFTIFRAALDQGHPVIAVAFLALLGLAFVAMAGIMPRMSQGKAPELLGEAPRETLPFILPPLLLGAAVFVLGVYIPAPLNSLLHEAANALGGR